MQNPGRAKYKFGNIHIELNAVLGGHLITAFHRTHRRRNDRSTGVFEAISWFQQRLLTHYAQAANFLRGSVAIHDNPCTTDQLRSHIANICNGNGIGKYVAIRFFIRLIR